MIMLVIMIVLLPLGLCYDNACYNDCVVAIRIVL